VLLILNSCYCICSFAGLGEAKIADIVKAANAAAAHADPAMRVGVVNKVIREQWPTERAKHVTTKDIFTRELLECLKKVLKTGNKEC
jgi:hypothetical protein